MRSIDEQQGWPLTRRELGVLAAAGVAAAAIRPTAVRAADAPVAAPPSSTELAAAEPTPVVLAGVPRGSGDSATEAAVRTAAQAATDFGWLHRGDSVLIKPVCNSGNAYPATTDPAALRAMIGLLRERGAGRVIVADMSGAQFLRFGKDHLRGSTRELMKGNQLSSSVESAGGEVQAFEESGWDAFFDESPVAGDSWSGPIMLPAILREVDHVVLMPRVGRHVLAGSTLGLKAAVGWWRHDTRLEYHRDAATLAEKTAEANTVPALRARQRLVLSSATRVLTTYGPDQGYIAEPETGLIIASTSVVAHDMVSLSWLLQNRRDMPAAERDGVSKDPNTSALTVNLGNRMVTRWLGGLGQALRADSLQRYDLATVWDDRVLRRAFEIEGGVPRIELIDDDDSIPAAVRQDFRSDLAPAV